MSQPWENAFLQQSLGLAAGEQSAPPKKPVFGSGGPRARPPPGPVPRLNADGSESLEYARYESAERLRRKWESIYERFRDAHLAEQDEIYLGRASDANDPLRVIKDCGSLRTLRRQLKFGSFMSEQEREALSLDGEALDDEADEEDAPLTPGDEAAAASDDDETPRAAAAWAARAVTSDAPARLDDERAPARRTAAATTTAAAAATAATAAADGVDVAWELDIYRSVKREAIESLLRSERLGRAACPYEIAGVDALWPT